VLYGKTARRRGAAEPIARHVLECEVARVVGSTARDCDAMADARHFADDELAASGAAHAIAVDEIASRPLSSCVAATQ
jgi:hypothetical protein